MCAVVLDGVSLFIITLFSSAITLLVFCGGGCDDLLVVLDIKPSVYSLGGYNPNAYGLPV